MVSALAGPIVNAPLDRDVPARMTNFSTVLARLGGARAGDRR